MLVQVLVNSIIDFFNATVSWLEPVTALPTVFGFDLDGALTTGIGEMRTLFNTFWVFEIIFQGFLVLMGYYVIKMLMRLFLGNRLPASH